MPLQTDGLTCTGAASFAGTVALPSNSLLNTLWNPSSPLAATNQEHQYEVRLAQAHGTAATAERRVVHVARAAGTIVSARVVPVAAAVGDSTVTVDVRVNGTSVLTGTIGITSAMAAYSKTSGTISTAAYGAGDVIEIVQTISAGTGTLPQGVCTSLVLREANGG